MNAKVRVIQRFDGKRLSIQPFLRNFRRWLIQKGIDDIDDIEELKNKRKSRLNST
jgi:hypothetical protein